MRGWQLEHVDGLAGFFLIIQKPEAAKVPQPGESGAYEEKPDVEVVESTESSGSGIYCSLTFTWHATWPTHCDSTFDVLIPLQCMLRRMNYLGAQVLCTLHPQARAPVGRICAVVMRCCSALEISRQIAELRRALTNMVDELHKL